MGIGLSEYSRDLTILNGLILEIWNHLRSFDPRALARPKFPILQLPEVRQKGRNF
jgi:hypothetical protein